MWEVEGVPVQCSFHANFNFYFKPLILKDKISCYLYRGGILSICSTYIRLLLSC